MTFASVIDRVNAACDRVFAESMTIDGVPCRGIYQRPYSEFSGISTADPTVRLIESSVPVEQGASLLCSAGLFRVRSIQTDGTDWATLLLERQ